jgi:hypothetical protein
MTHTVDGTQNCAVKTMWNRCRKEVVPSDHLQTVSTLEEEVGV